MIRQVSRQKLAVDKYTDCLKKSVNYRVYAEFWYLDTLVGENWDCLIYKDYEAVMPLPFVRKFGIKLITQPLYCQQLGVFHQKEFTGRIFQEFEKRLHRKLVRSYNFNEENTAMFSPKGKLRVNQILDISNSYEELYNNFSLNRKRNIKKNSFNKLNIDQSFFDVEWYFEALEKNYAYSKTINLSLFEEIINKNIQRKNCTQYFLFDENKRIISSVFLLHSSDRIILLSSVRNKDLEPKGSFSYLLNHIIKDHCGRSLIFDFEGSNIKGIQDYYASYNSEIRYYSNYKNFLNFFSKNSINFKK